MKTWVFAQPIATGSNGWAGKAMVAGLDLTNVDRMTAFYEDDAKLIAAAPDFLAACETILAELEEQNAQEGMALTITEKAEWLTPGFRAMVAALKKAKALPSEGKVAD